MSRPRTFDWDEARARYKRGETLKQIADSYGVSDSAVWRMLKPERLARDRAAAAKWNEKFRVSCETCGDPCLSVEHPAKAPHNPDGRTLCARCRGDEKTERFLFNERGSLVSVRCVMLDCANGERWQSPDNFPRGSRSRHIREGGIHGQCRACLTRARREYRAAHPEVTAAENKRARDARRKQAVS